MDTERNKRIYNILLDVLFAIASFIGIFTVVWAFQHEFHPLLKLSGILEYEHVKPEFGERLLILIEPLVLGMIVWLIFQALLIYVLLECVRRYFLPSYKIMYYEDAIVVVGGYCISDFEFICNKMLGTRTDYAVTDSVPKMYKGTLAAIPKQDVDHDELTRELLVARSLERQGIRIEFN